MSLFKHELKIEDVRTEIVTLYDKAMTYIWNNGSICYIFVFEDSLHKFHQVHFGNNPALYASIEKGDDFEVTYTEHKIIKINGIIGHFLS